MLLIPALPDKSEIKSRASISAACGWGYQTLCHLSVAFLQRGLAMLLAQRCDQQTSLSNGDRDANLSVATLEKVLELRLYNWNVGGSLLPVTYVLFVIYFSPIQNNKLSKLLAALSPNQVSWKTRRLLF